MRLFNAIINAILALLVASYAAPPGLLPTTEAASIDRRMITGLPDNVEGDFWDVDRPRVNQNESLHFELLTCDRAFNKKKGRVSPGDCHYMAGSLARYSELHLTIDGTRSLIATCGMAKHMRRLGRKNYEGALWFDDIEQASRLKNGLCDYYLKFITHGLKIAN